MNSDFVIRSAENDGSVARVADFLHGIFGHGRDYVLTHPDVRRPGVGPPPGVAPYHTPALSSLSGISMVSVKRCTIYGSARLQVATSLFPARIEFS